MLPYVPSPTHGADLRSSWGSKVAECCNAMRPIGTGGLVRDGAGGFGEVALPTNLRDRRSGGCVAPDNGCWKIVSSTRTVDGSAEQEAVSIFANQFAMVGGVLHAFDIATAIEDIVARAVISDESSRADLFIVLRLAADGSDKNPEIDGYTGLEMLRAAQADWAWHTLPIYLADVTESTTNTGQKKRSWSIKCDFRRSIAAQQVEAL